MEITVTMTPDDFMEFMVLKTLEEREGTRVPQYKIGSQVDAVKLVKAAYEVF